MRTVARTRTCRCPRASLRQGNRRRRRSREAVAPFMLAEATNRVAAGRVVAVCRAAREALGGACRTLQSSEVTSSRLVHSSERIVGSFCTRRRPRALGVRYPSQTRARARGRRPAVVVVVSCAHGEAPTGPGQGGRSGARLHAWAKAGPSALLGAGMSDASDKKNPIIFCRWESAARRPCAGRSVPWARLGKARQGTARQGKARQGKARQGKAGFWGLRPAQMWAAGRPGRFGSQRSAVSEDTTTRNAA
jgi:hypothetical protein